MKLLAFRENGLFGLMDTSRNIKVPPTFLECYSSANGKCLVIYSDGIGLIDTGTLTLKRINGWKNFTYFFSNGLIPVKKVGSKSYGYLDTDGNIAIEPRFQWAGEFDSFGANIKLAEKNVKNRIDFSGNVMGRDYCDILAFHPKGILSGGRIAPFQYVLVNGTGERISTRIFKNVRQEHEGKVPVQFSNDIVGWVDPEGRTMEKFRAGGIGDHFQNGLIPVENFEGKWGIMSGTLSWVVDPIFDVPYALGSNRFALGRTEQNGNSHFQVYDGSGKLLSANSFDFVNSYDEGFAQVSRIKSSNESEYTQFEFNYLDMDGNLLSEKWY
jgi:hypothetical protein